VTVQVLEAPLPTLPGLQDRAATNMGATRVTREDSDVKFKMPVMAALWVMGSMPAETRKVPVVVPTGTVTEAGTVNSVLLSKSAMVLPPPGAG